MSYVECKKCGERKEIPNQLDAAVLSIGLFLMEHTCNELYHFSLGDMSMKFKKGVWGNISSILAPPKIKSIKLD